MLRTIMIFPEFDNAAVIDSIRQRYDPLASAVRPHITLVFPFISSISNAQLRQILARRLRFVKPFVLRMGGFSRSIDRYGCALFLNVLEGAEVLSGISRLLYDHEFREFDSGFPYTPHLTVGSFSDPEELDRAYEAVRSLPDQFVTTVRHICVEEIGPKEESIIVIDHALHKK